MQLTLEDSSPNKPPEVFVPLDDDIIPPYVLAILNDLGMDPTTPISGQTKHSDYVFKPGGRVSRYVLARTGTN